MFPCRLGAKAWNVLELSQEQSAHRGCDLTFLPPELIPGQLGHFTSSRYLSSSRRLPIGTSWFNKHNCFLHPPPKATVEIFSRDMINTPNWALILLRASSSSRVSASVISFSVSTLNLTLTFFLLVRENSQTLFAQVWAQEPYSPSQFRGSASSSSSQ